MQITNMSAVRNVIASLVVAASALLGCAAEPANEDSPVAPEVAAVADGDAVGTRPNWLVVAGGTCGEGYATLNYGPSWPTPTNKDNGYYDYGPAPTGTQCMTWCQQGCRRSYFSLNYYPGNPSKAICRCY